MRFLFLLEPCQCHMKLRKQSLLITIILRKALIFCFWFYNFNTVWELFFYFISQLTSVHGVHVYSKDYLKILTYCNTVCVIFLMQPFSLEFPGCSEFSILDVVGLICFFKMIWKICGLILHFVSYLERNVSGDRPCRDFSSNFILTRPTMSVEQANFSLFE